MIIIIIVKVFSKNFLHWFPQMNINGFDRGDEQGRPSFETVGQQLDITGFNRKEKNNSVYFK